MTDRFQNQSTTLESPARNAVAITPNDSADLPFVTRAIWVGVDGTLTVVMYSGVEVAIPAAVGLLPICVRRVKATGTTATGLVAFE